MCEEEDLAELHQYFEGLGFKVFDMMAAIAEGTKPLINCVAEELQKLPPIKRYEPEEAPPEDFADRDKHTFTLRRENDAFIIEAQWLLRILDTVDPDDYESLQYFQRVLHQSGIIDALEKAGVQEGDTVSLYDFDFEFVTEDHLFFHNV